LGEREEARKQINLAQNLDPLSPAINVMNAIYYDREGDYNASLDAYQKTAEISSYNMKNVNVGFFRNYYHLGDSLKALEFLERYLSLDSLNAKHIQYVREEIYNRSGWRSVLNWLTEFELKNVIPSLSFAVCWEEMPDRKSEMLDCLEKKMHIHTSEYDRITKCKDDLPRINSNPDFDFLRSEPRFIKLIEKMDLAKYHSRKPKN
jgi:tetratricopeptide (TPR) repeat protein